MMILFGVLAARRVSLNQNKEISFFNLEVIFPLLFYSVILGMRYGVGEDHLGYLGNYITGDRVDQYEWGFRLLTNIFKKNGIHYAVYFSVLAFLQIFFFYYAFKDERYLYPYLAFVLITGGYFLSWMNGIRQDLADCIFIYFLKIIDKKQIFNYTIWCLAACLFHKSAIILLVLYPILKDGRDYFKNISFQLIIYCFALAIHYSNFDVTDLISRPFELFAYWLQYKDYSFDASRYIVGGTDTGIGFIILALIDFLIILCSYRIKEYFSSKRFINIYNIYFIGTVTNIIFAGSFTLLRPFRYFTYFALIVEAYLLYYLYQKAKSSFNIIILVFFVLLVLLIFGKILTTEKFIFFWQ